MQTACTAWQGLGSTLTAEILLYQPASCLIVGLEYTRYLEELAASSNLQSGGMLLVFEAYKAPKHTLHAGTLEAPGRVGVPEVHACTYPHQLAQHVCSMPLRTPCLLCRACRLLMATVVLVG